MSDAEQPTAGLYREAADRLRELAKHHRRKGKMRNQRVRDPMVLASARGHEILHAQVAVVEQRLRQTVGETEWLAGPENLAALADLPGQWIDAVHKRRQPRVVVLDMGLSESPTYGAQGGSAYNGHFGCT